MKSLLIALLGFALCLCVDTASGSAPAAAPELPPVRLRDKGMKPLLQVREHQFKGYPATGEPNTVPCRIRYTDKYFGYLKDRDYYFQEKFRLQSGCYFAEKFEGLESVPLRFDPERREWVPDIEKRLKWAATAIGQEELDPAYKKLRRDALRAFTLKSVNAQGFAFTEEDVIGDEKSRTRSLDYCLFHAEVALCGRGDVGNVVEGPRGDLTEYVLQILRSIEFLPNIPSPAASAGAPAGEASAPPR